ncbi:LCP family protein [Candidatus Gottesmanbacteria bacterium]|nr:LCP family protein [Candidatus Gottesmanbacteria bacterium]
MHPKIRRFLTPYVQRGIVMAILFVFVYVFTKLAFWTNEFMHQTGITPLTAWNLAFDTGVPLKSSNGRTNILILGIGGGTHTGADLTDTMMVVSIDGKGNKIALTSLPRDLWSDTLKDKINSAYHYGEEKKKGGGVILTKAVVEDVVGLPMQYTLLIDFSGFTKVIDRIGGIDIVVPKAFTDTEFPIEGKENDLCGGDTTYACRYEVITFEQGLQHMDGVRALKYVRSRHSEGDEGSDFARARRQQDVMVAIKQKLLSWSTYEHFRTLSEIITAFDNATETDMRIGELATIAKIASRISQESITRISLEDDLMSPPLWMYGKYVLVPKESFEKIHEHIKEKLQ